MKSKKENNKLGVEYDDRGTWNHLIKTLCLLGYTNKRPIIKMRSIIDSFNQKGYLVKFGGVYLIEPDVRFNNSYSFGITFASLIHQRPFLRLNSEAFTKVDKYYPLFSGVLRHLKSYVMIEPDILYVFHWRKFHNFNVTLHYKTFESMSLSPVMLDNGNDITKHFINTISDVMDIFIGVTNELNMRFKTGNRTISNELRTV